jgi:hypothetical protein
MIGRRAFLGACYALPWLGCRAPESAMSSSYRAELHPATFIGGDAGAWKVERITPIIGEGLASVSRVDVAKGHGAGGTWALRGVAGHARYVEAKEKVVLDERSPPLGRPEATCAVLIPIRKSAAWWSMPQDARRAVFEERSRHIADSLAYLPRVARRLYHARDLGEPFDFLTWFELAPEHEKAFDELLALLRSREEWKFVDREVEIRLRRA